MSAKTYYEAHITMVRQPEHMVMNSVLVEVAVKDLKWKFSKIDGDPTLGAGLKYYATKHFNAKQNKEMVLAELHHVADKLAENKNIKVVRRKIELVIYDDRSNTINFSCNGLCPECHIDEGTLV